MLDNPLLNEAWCCSSWVSESQHLIRNMNIKNGQFAKTNTDDELVHLSLLLFSDFPRSTQPQALLPILQLCKLQTVQTEVNNAFVRWAQYTSGILANSNRKNWVKIMLPVLSWQNIWTQATDNISVWTNASCLTNMYTNRCTCFLNKSVRNINFLRSSVGWDHVSLSIMRITGANTWGFSKILSHMHTCWMSLYVQYTHYNLVLHLFVGNLHVSGGGGCQLIEIHSVVNNSVTSERIRLKTHTNSKLLHNSNARLIIWKNARMCVFYTPKQFPGLEVLLVSSHHSELQPSMLCKKWRLTCKRTWTTLPAINVIIIIRPVIIIRDQWEENMWL